MDQLHGTLEQVFRVVFELPVQEDPRAVTQEGCAAWDSLGHVSLMTALESEFGIRVSLDQSMDVTSFASALALVEEHATSTDAD